MSLERAYVNCLRCYALSTGIFASGNYTNDSLWTARNDALRGLEKELEVHALVGPVSIDSESNLACEALKSCAGCAYESPKIANVVQKWVLPKQ